MFQETDEFINTLIVYSIKIGC